MLFVSGKFEIIADHFWTLPFCYNYLEKIDKNLYKDLSTSKLLIFKGDLNYRKLIGDINWPPTTPFKDALQGFQPSTIVALRSLKAESVSGLEPGKAEKAESMSSKWKISGNFGVIQISV